MREINKLTDSKCRNAEIKEKSYKISDGRGLYLFVLNTGGKSWRYNYKFNGICKTITFGLFPDLTVKDAREKLNTARHKLANGIDPLEERQSQSKYHNNKYSVRKIALELRQQKINQAQGTLNAFDIILNKHIFPVLGNYNIAHLKLIDLKNFIQKYLGKNMYTMATRIIIVLNQIYKYAQLYEYCEDNKAHVLYNFIKPYKPKENKEYPVLTNIKDVKDMIQYIYHFMMDNKNNRFSPIVRCIFMLPFTVQRAQELYKARWQDIDIKQHTLTVHSENVKTRKEYILPLPSKIYFILLEFFENQFFKTQEDLHSFSLESMFKMPLIRRQYIFQGKGKTGHLTCNGIRKAMYSAGIEKGKMCLHSWRKVFSTIAHNEGVPSNLIESILNHSTGNRIELTYNKANYLESKRAVLQWWEDYLFTLIYNKTELPKIQNYIDEYGQRKSKYKF